MSSSVASSTIIKILIGTFSLLGLVAILTYFGLQYFKSVKDSLTGLDPTTEPDKKMKAEDGFLYTDEEINQVCIEQ